MTSFVNPYSFIPFGEKPDRSDPAEAAVDAKERKTGWMEIAVKAETPLIIPGKMLSEESTGHKNWDFFKLPNGTCAIPGSTLRGMIRTVYEAASNSCLPFVLDREEIITSRTPVYAPFKDRALLSYDSESQCWELYQAKVYPVNDDIRSEKVNTKLGNGKYHAGNQIFQNAQPVQFKVVDDKAVLSESEGESGWLQFQVPVAISKSPTAKGRIPSYHVCVLTKGPLLFRWDAGIDVPYQDLQAELKYTIDNSSRVNEAHRALEKALEQKDTVPVWYLKTEHGGEANYYVSPSSIGRIHQRRNWREVMGEYAPCTDPHQLCEACQLFGTASEESKMPLKVKGKLRFSDGLPAGEIILNEVYPQILASPKQSAFEFYLEKPTDKANYWNFDYYSENGDKEGEFHYHHLDHAMPRGRKMYWHSDRQYTLRNPQREKSKMTSSFKAAQTGSQFVFRLYFDGISEKQLKELQWVITLGDSAEEKKHLHKLGHARPLGFGSVKMTILSIAERYVHMDDGVLRYTPPESKKIDVQWKCPCPWDKEKDAVNSLLNMSDTTKTKGKIVHYPLQKNKNGKVAIFEWFGQNRRASGIRTLPFPKDKTIELESNCNPEDFGITSRNTQGTKEAQTDNLIATVKGFNPAGSVKLSLPDGKGKGFLPRTQSGWQDKLQTGQQIKVSIIRYDEEHKSYTVKYISNATE